MLILLPFLHVCQSFVAAHAYDLLAPSERQIYDVMETLSAPFVKDPAEDLDAVKAALADVASRHTPFETSIDFNDLRSGDSGYAYSLFRDGDHFALQADVEQALIPLTKRLRPTGQPYWPHTTLVLDVKPEEIPLVEQHLINLDLSRTMRFESIELIGRVGPSRGGEYRVLASFALNG